MCVFQISEGSQAITVHDIGKHTDFTFELLGEGSKCRPPDENIGVCACYFDSQLYCFSILRQIEIVRAMMGPKHSLHCLKNLSVTQDHLCHGNVRHHISLYTQPEGRRIMSKPI